MRPSTSSSRSPEASVVGFNATRRYRDSKWNDIALLVGALLVIGAAVAWAAGLI
jgi:hypothetical protein